jgi:hypothetical protein
MKEYPGIRIFGIMIIFIVLIVTTIFAGDGQIDILPNGSEAFVISKRGSYVLTDNVMMSADVNCIKITAGEVTLDLNGHTITGTGENSYGIYGVSAGKVTICNGNIQSFGKIGILLHVLSRVENIVVSSCGGKGIVVSTGEHVISCTTYYNKGFGIEAGGDSLVERCISRTNGRGYTAGISVGENSTVRDCISSGNNSYVTTQNIDIYGIRAGNGSTIINNTCNANTNNTSYNGGTCYGIKAGDGCTIVNNSCYRNIATGQGTDVIGIYAGAGSSIIGNTIRRSAATGEAGESRGISAGESCLIKDNACSDNNSAGTNSNACGIFALSGCRIQGNTCDNNEGKKYSKGINVDEGGCHVEGNLCSRHDEVTNGIGIYLNSALNDCVVIRNTSWGNDTGISMGNGGHYCAENIIEDGTINTTGVKMGTGDRANVSY